MRGGTLQITWHENKPVLTLDFHRLTGLLATGGADFDIKLWSLHPCENKKDTVKAVYESSLAYHNSAVNVIRFAPSGEQLASGADGGDLLIWKRYKTESGASWKVLKTLSFHRKDVLDLQWSPDGAFLITGSVDNSCIIWDATKGTVHQILDSHAHYVQGVTWDPAGQYVASLSSDRTCKIYSNRPRKAKGRGQEKINYVCQHVISKAELQKHEKDQSSKFNLFHDETLPSFFRRLEWSPDGSFLVVPAGILKFSPDSSVSNTAHIFSRKDFSRPALQLPGSSKPVVAVRFCPVLFKLNAIDSDGPFRLPYRIVFALATLNSLYIYDTESNSPIGIYAGLHYAAITDIAWSFDAKYLAVSSQDCYCTIVEFEDGDLGCPASSVDIPSQIASNMVQPIIDITPLQAEIMDIDTPETGTNEIVSGSLNSSMDIENQIAEAKQSEPKKLNDTVKLADESQSKQLECSTAEEKPELRYVCMDKQEECAVEKEKHEYHMQIDTNESLITRQEHTSASVQQTDDIKRDQTPSNVRTEKPSKKRITPIAL